MAGQLPEYAYHAVPAEVSSALEADDGRLWLGTEQGIAAYDPRSKSFEMFTVEDGVTEGTFRFGSAVRAADGTMYFGSYRSGVTYFDPKAIRRNKIPPRVAITTVMADNFSLTPERLPSGVAYRPATSGGQLTLSHRQSTLTVEFSAMHFADPARNSYAYRLDGYDEDWRSTNADKPFALYGSLPPGEYTLRVKAANKHGIWSVEPTTLNILVAPAWWATWWFRTLSGCLLAALLWFAYRARVQQLIRKQTHLEAVVQERTSQVRTAMAQLTAAQEELVLREKMASVGTLTAGMAHEINNPANFVHVGAQLLRTDLERFHQLLYSLMSEDVDGAVRAKFEERFTALYERIGTISTGTVRICELVKNLRTFSRLDEADWKVVDPVDGLISTIQLVSPQFADQIEFTTALAFRPVIECAPAQLNQVFMNVIVNACQAIQTRRQNDPGAPPGVLHVSSRQDGNYCLLEFEDNGCGISEDVLDHIFEPFFTTKEVGSGTGLGLSISFAIIQQHRGNISARSSTGKNTLVSIRLPLIPDTQSA
jgi:signal transduction histidine kinase